MMSLEFLILILSLNEQFDSLDWCADSFGNDARKSTSKKIMNKIFMALLCHRVLKKKN